MFLMRMIICMPMSWRSMRLNELDWRVMGWHVRQGIILSNVFFIGYLLLNDGLAILIL
jgi:hypothetical protein